VLGDEHPELERLGDTFSGLPEWRPRIAQRAKDLQTELGALARRRCDVRQAVQAAVDRINGQPGRLATWRGLDALIQDQYWRAAHFRVAAGDINYRRFFNINELAGLRMELPELFDQAHHLAFELLRDGVLDGLRIDHIDALLDPKGYLLRLREQAPRSFYLIVEKILARHEVLGGLAGRGHDRLRIRQPGPRLTGGSARRGGFYSILSGFYWRPWRLRRNRSCL